MMDQRGNDLTKKEKELAPKSIKEESDESDFESDESEEEFVSMGERILYLKAQLEA